MWVPNVEMKNGEIFEAKKIRELSVFVIDKFSEEKLSYDQAKIVLDDISAIIGECAAIETPCEGLKITDLFGRVPVANKK